MITLVLTMSVRQLLGQRRTLLLLALGLLPVVSAIIYRAGGGGDLTIPEFTAKVVLEAFIVNGALPLTALILGTAAFGNEIEDGTITYLLAKPIARWRILLGKLLAGWGTVALIVLASTVVSVTIMLVGEGGWRLLTGFAVALLAGSLAYTALFALLSLLTSRALLVGLVYAFIWEGVVTNFAPGVQRFSVREYTLGIAEFVADTEEHIFDATLGFTFSVTLVAVVTAAAAALAVRRLSRFELTGDAA